MHQGAHWPASQHPLLASHLTKHSKRVQSADVIRAGWLYDRTNPRILSAHAHLMIPIPCRCELRINAKPPTRQARMTTARSLAEAPILPVSFPCRLCLVFLLTLLVAHTLALPTKDASEDATPAVWSIRCVYAVSGLYTRFQRILFYLVICIVFIFRSHEWLSAAGIIWLAGYVFVAAIHGLALAMSPTNGVDADLPVIFTILITSCAATTIHFMTPRGRRKRPRYRINLPSHCLALVTQLFLLITVIMSVTWKMSSWYTSGIRVHVSDSGNIGAQEILHRHVDECAAVSHISVVFRSAGDELQPLGKPQDMSDSSSARIDFWKQVDVLVSGRPLTVDTPSVGIQAESLKSYTPLRKFLLAFSPSFRPSPNVILSISSINILYSPRVARNCCFGG